jgi:hypothetical protein
VTPPSISQAAVQIYGVQELNNPTNNQNLAPSHYLLIIFLKKFQQGKRFSSNEEIERCSLFESQHSFIILRESSPLKLVLEGDYIKK